MEVPVPLSAEVWSRAIFKRPTRPDRLVAAILADRRAALLCYGLAALDDETLGVPRAARIAADQSVRERRAGVRRVRREPADPRQSGRAAGRTPKRSPLWEADRSGARRPIPKRSSRALFQMHDGRVAYLYDTVAQLEPPPGGVRARRVDDRSGGARSRASPRWSTSAAAAIGNGGSTRLPFSKPLHDLAMLLHAHAGRARTACRPPRHHALLVGGVRRATI